VAHHLSVESKLNGFLRTSGRIQSISGNISEMVQDSDVVTRDH